MNMLVRVDVDDDDDDDASATSVASDPSVVEVR